MTVFVLLELKIAQYRGIDPRWACHQVHIHPVHGMCGNTKKKLIANICILQPAIGAKKTCATWGVIRRSGFHLRGTCTYSCRKMIQKMNVKPSFFVMCITECSVAVDSV